MSKSTPVVEVSCDFCVSAERFCPPYVNEQARNTGWLIMKGNLHFCSNSCMAGYKARWPDAKLVLLR
jgi:hypothetical protein